VFNSKKKKAERQIGKMLTASGLLKAAMADDRDAVTAILFGDATTDEAFTTAIRAATQGDPRLFRGGNPRLVRPYSFTT